MESESKFIQHTGELIAVSQPKSTLRQWFELRVVYATRSCFSLFHRTPRTTMSMRDQEDTGSGHAGGAFVDIADAAKPTFEAFGYYGIRSTLPYVLDWTPHMSDITIPAMSCPSCSQPLANGNVDNGAAATHDTSVVSIHITTDEWLEQLSDAVKSTWSKRRFEYSEVAVLMLSWDESDMRQTDREIERLGSIFRNAYNYRVTNWKIPLRRPGSETARKYMNFAAKYMASDCLLIVYYAGHAKPSNAQFPLWQSKSDGGSSMDSGQLITQLASGEDEAPDILFIQDCCCPLSGYKSPLDPTTSVVECLYSGGFDAQVPIPGPFSFTRGLIDELATAVNAKCSLAVSSLHRRLIDRFQSNPSTAVFSKKGNPRMRDDQIIMTSDDKITPLHTFLAPAKPPRSIILTPLASKNVGRTNTPAQGDSSEPSWPRVLIAVRLRDDRDNMEDDLKNWILTAPAGVVEFKGFYESYSCLLLVELPVEVWDLLPPCGAVSFIGFIRSPLHELQASTRRPSEIPSGAMSDQSRFQSTLKPRRLPPLGFSVQKSVIVRSKSGTQELLTCPLLAARLVGHAESGVSSRCEKAGFSDMDDLQ
ncbi:hypothetical protein PG984_008090 [Apiospora sp. TS-2023a]